MTILTLIKTYCVMYIFRMQDFPNTLPPPPFHCFNEIVILYYPD